MKFSKHSAVQLLCFAAFFASVGAAHATAITDPCMPTVKCFGKYLKPMPFNPALNSAIGKINADPKAAEQFSFALSKKDGTSASELLKANGFADADKVTIIRPRSMKRTCKRWKIIRIWINPDNGGTYCEMVCTS